MCHFRSYIVTRSAVLSCGCSDSHEDIIEYYDLDDDTEFPNFVRVELTPPHPNDLSKDASGRILVDGRWGFRIDEYLDRIPDWVDPKEIEQRTRDVLQKELDTSDIYKYRAQDLYPFGVELSVATSNYLVSMTHYRGPMPTTQEVPNHCVRHILASKLVSLLDRPITMQEEPIASVRYALSYKVRRYYPLTAEEENVESTRHRYIMLWDGQFPVHRQRMLTAQEEPNHFDRLWMWAKYRSTVNIPDEYQGAVVPKPGTPEFQIAMNPGSGYCAAENPINQQVAYLLCMVNVGATTRLDCYSAVAVTKTLEILEGYNPQLCGK